MGRASFQGTLHKIASGQVSSPSRGSAERIAKHFNIPVDALYNDSVATEVFFSIYGDHEARPYGQPVLNSDSDALVFCASEPDMPYPVKDFALNSLTALDDLLNKIHPSLSEAGRLAAIRWLEGKASIKDAVATLNGLVSASENMANPVEQEGRLSSKRTGTG